MSQIEIDFGADATSDAATEGTVLQRVTRLVELLAQQETEMREAAAAAAEAKARYNDTRMGALPELMLNELGLTTLTTAAGLRVEIREEVSASIREPNREAAYEWLIDHGFGGLIKTQVVVEFPRGAADEAHECARRIAEQLLPGSQAELGVSEAIHPASLVAFVKERAAAGDPVPQELFDVFPYNVAKITKSTTQRTKR